jgi:AcrR family transcriptional regulator
VSVTAEAQQDLTPSGRRRRRTPDQVRELLITSGRDLFSTYGYAGTHTRQIARTADVSETLIYTHFGGKAGLFRKAVLEPFVLFMSEYLEEWRDYSGDPHSRERPARRYVEGMYDLLRNNRGLAMAMLTANLFEDGVADDVSAHDSPLADVFQIAEQIMTVEAERNDIRNLDIPVVVRFSFGLVLSVAVLDGPLLAGMPSAPNRDKLIDELTAYTLYGTASRPTPS